jgi:ubiquinone/menaquinone biosynthesis C-methylase UbiE
MTEVSPVPGSTGGQHILAKWIDHDETYGAHVIERLVRGLPEFAVVVDIGAGTGRDLNIAKKQNPTCKTIAIEAGKEYAAQLEGKVDQVVVANIERDRFPFEDESVDLIIANQILEHTKEIFWIFHEMSRVLKPDGRLVFGVPNVLSLHNRIIGLFGTHPTQHKLYSAHVRPFSKHDTVKFMDVCSPGTFRLENFAGSQFYPLPKLATRQLSRVFPSLSFSIFFEFKKIGKYKNGFVIFPSEAGLETNFYTGDINRGQY